MRYSSLSTIFTLFLAVSSAPANDKGLQQNACLINRVDASSFPCPSSLAKDEIAVFSDPSNPCAAYFFQCEPNRQAVCKSCPYLGGDNFLYFHAYMAEGSLPAGYCDWRANVPACANATIPPPLSPPRKMRMMKAKDQEVLAKKIQIALKEGEAPLVAKINEATILKAKPELALSAVQVKQTIQDGQLSLGQKMANGAAQMDLAEAQFLKNEVLKENHVLPQNSVVHPDAMEKGQQILIAKIAEALKLGDKDEASLALNMFNKVYKYQQDAMNSQVDVKGNTALLTAQLANAAQKGLVAERSSIALASTTRAPLPCDHVDSSRFHCPHSLATDRVATFADPLNPCSPYFFQCEPNRQAVCKNCPRLGADSYLYFNPQNGTVPPSGYCDWRSNVPAC